MWMMWFSMSAVAACPEAPAFEREAGDGISSRELGNFFKYLQVACDESGTYSEGTRRSRMVYAERALKKLSDGSERDLSSLSSFLNAVRGSVDSDHVFVYEDDDQMARRRGTEGHPAPKRPGFELGPEHARFRARVRDIYKIINDIVDPRLYPKADPSADVERARTKVAALDQQLDGAVDLAPLQTYLQGAEATAVGLQEEALALQTLAMAFQAQMIEIKQPLYVDVNTPAAEHLKLVEGWSAAHQGVLNPDYRPFQRPELVGDTGLDFDKEQAFYAAQTFPLATRIGLDAWGDHVEAALLWSTTASDLTSRCTGYGKANALTCVAADLAWSELTLELVSDPRIKRAHDTLASYSSSQGSLAAAQSADRASAAARLASVDMPSSRSVPGADAAARAAFKATGWNEPLLRLAVTSDWRMVRHPVSGAIIARDVSVVIAAKQGPDNCNKYSMTVRQEKTPSGWGRSYRRGHDTGSILCSKVGG